MALGVSVFFELFWIDQIAAGTFIPPHNLLSTFFTFSLCHLLGFSYSNQVVIILPFALFLGLLGSKVESIQRVRQNKSYNQIIHWTRKENDFLTERLVRRSLFSSMTVNFILFFSVQIVFWVVLRRVVDMAGTFLSSFSITWMHLWLLATIGPLISLRQRRPYLVLALAIILAGISLWLFWG